MQESDPALDEIASTMILNTKEPEKAPVKEEAKVEEDIQEDIPESETDVSEQEETTEETEEAQEQEEETPEEDIDIDEVEVEVTVDGETKPVKLKDLKANYSGEGAIQKRLQEATEIKQKTYEVGSNLYNNLQQVAQRLEKLDEILANASQPDINWEELRQKEPGRYLLEKERVREIEEKRAQVNRERERIQAEQDELNQIAMRDITIQQARMLVQKIPDLAKPETATKVMNEFIETAKSYGFDPADVHGIIDHRLMLVLADAAKYRKMIAEKNPNNPQRTLKEVKPRPLVRPSASAKNANAVNALKKQHMENVKRAKASGKVEDVANLLIVRKKSG
jgi:hypothetical protein